MRRTLLAIATLAVTLAAPARCHAATQEFQGSGTGSNAGLEASVAFSTSGSNLQVQLTNMSPFTVSNPAQVLTGVFFDISSNPALSTGPGSSALVAPGSAWVNYSVPGFTGDVGGEWAFKSGFGSGLPRYGLGASGLGGTFGSGDTFTGVDLSGGNGAGGVDWGLVSNNYSAGDGNGGISSEPLIRNSAIFTLTAPGFDLATVTFSNVRFQYGTTMDEPTIDGSPVPEPGTLSILGLAVAPLVARRLRRRRAAKSAISTL